MVVLVSALAEEQGVLVEEEVPLHGFESGQLFHSHRCPFMADPHATAALHHDTTQMAEITLCQGDRQMDTLKTHLFSSQPVRKILCFALIRLSVMKGHKSANQ